MQKSKDVKKTLEDDVFVYYLDSGDGFTYVYKRQNLSNNTH